MTVLARPPQEARAGTAGHGAGERDHLGRIPRDLWQGLGADEEARERYYGKVYWRGPGQCAYFLGALSSGGHGRFRAGTRRAVADRPGSLVVPAHIYGYVLSRGVPGPDPVTGCLPVIRHRCDEPSCQAALHLAAGSPAENSRDYLARRADPYSPLSDRRGPRRPAGAIRGALLGALAGGPRLGGLEGRGRGGGGGGRGGGPRGRRPGRPGGVFQGRPGRRARRGGGRGRALAPRAWQILGRAGAAPATSAGPPASPPTAGPATSPGGGTQCSLTPRSLTPPSRGPALARRAGT